MTMASENISPLHVVSGVSSGIGYCVAEVLLNRGCCVVGLSRNRPLGLDSKYFKWLEVDLEAGDSPLTISSFFEKLEYSKIKSAFSNAGSYEEYVHGISSVDVFHRQLSSNFFSHLNFTNGILPWLNYPEGPSAIVFNTTDQVYRTKFGGAAYAAAKSALNSYARSLAVELVKNKIVVSSVAPGGVNTPLYWDTKRGLGPDEISRSQSKYPSGGIGDVIEVANFVSDLLMYPKLVCTGSEFRIDGGLCCT